MIATTFERLKDRALFVVPSETQTAVQLLRKQEADGTGVVMVMRKIVSHNHYGLVPTETTIAMQPHQSVIEIVLD